MTKPATPRGLERDLQSSIVDALKRMGVWVERCNSGRVKVRGAWMNLHAPGFPDLMCILRGRIAFIEIKRSEDEEPSVEQASAHETLRALEHPVATCWTVQQAVDFVRAERGRAAR